MQTGFDFTGLTDQLGQEGVRKLIDQWLQLQQMLAARGHAIPKCGRLLTAMTATAGEAIVRLIIKSAKAPTLRQAQAMMMAWEYFGTTPLSDDEAAVLDAICYKSMTRDLRMFAFRKIREGAGAEEILDLVESIRPPGGSGTQPHPQITEDDVKRQYAKMLAEDNYDVHTEQPTRDGGRVDIVATRGDETIIAECKVELTRDTITTAIGQLDIYSRTYSGAAMQIVHLSGQKDAAADKIARVCSDTFFVKGIVVRAEEPQT